MDNLGQLRTFLSVYQCGSVTKAAEFLNLTQPAVTKQLQQLEARVGKQLFSRMARGVQATPAAHELAQRIEKHLEALEAVAQTLKVSQKTLAGTVFLGGPAEFIGHKILPSLLPAVQERIQIRVQLAEPDALKNELLIGTIDLGVFTVQRSHPKLQTALLYKEELVLVGNREWANRLPQNPESGILEQVPLLGYAEDLPMLRRYWRVVFGAKPSVSAALVIPDLHALELATIAGYGITVLPKYSVEKSLASGALLELHQPSQAPSNQLYLAWREPLQARVELVRDMMLRSAYGW